MVISSRRDAAVAHRYCVLHCARIIGGFRREVLRLGLGEKPLVSASTFSGNNGGSLAGLDGDCMPSHSLGNEASGAGWRCRIFRKFRFTLDGADIVLRRTAMGIHNLLYRIRLLGVVELVLGAPCFQTQAAKIGHHR